MPKENAEDVHRRLLAELENDRREQEVARGEFCRRVADQRAWERARVAAADQDSRSKKRGSETAQ